MPEESVMGQSLSLKEAYQKGSFPLLTEYWVSHSFKQWCCKYNRIKSHEDYLGDDAKVLCEASTSEAINASLCPLILYFTNVNYKTR